MPSDVLRDKMRRRAEGIREWLSDEAPYTVMDQKNLDANTPEKAYWHLGYLSALVDIERLLAELSTPKHGNKGK